MVGEVGDVGDGVGGEGIPSVSLIDKAWTVSVAGSDAGAGSVSGITTVSLLLGLEGASAPLFIMRF